MFQTAKTFLREHLSLLFVTLVGLALYCLSDKFAELIYGALRVGVTLSLVFLFVFIVFNESLRKYLYEGKFVEEFWALEPQKRPWFAIAIIAIIVYLCTSSMTHAGSITELQESRWEKADIRKEKVHFVEATCAQIERNRSRYVAVSKHSGVPWQVIACLHNMECSLSFREHLHNGDSLAAKTHNVPAGRPAGNPPFQWEYSAVDALKYDRLGEKRWNTTGNTLLNIENYNGSGYLRNHPNVPTPYLWSWTTLYSRGKYVSDGKFDPYAVSQQCGVAAILKKLPL